MKPHTELSVAGAAAHLTLLGQRTTCSILLGGPRAGCVCETLLTSKKMKMIWVQEFKAEEGEDHFNREGAAVHKVAIKYLSC